jgi:hypothetical protein
VINSNEFQNFTESQVSTAIEKIKTIGIQNNLLVLWKSHASPPMIKGFFYSKKQGLLDAVAKNQQSATKNDWIFLSMQGLDINSAKESIIKMVIS